MTVKTTRSAVASPTSDSSSDIRVPPADEIDLYDDGSDDEEPPSSSGSESDGQTFSCNTTDATYSGFDKTTISSLVAEYGSSSATAWLEFDRYRIWQAKPGQIKESSFLPVQGYMQRKKYVFAWGDPLVSSPEALRPTALAFINWATGQGLRPIWCCADLAMEEVLAEIGWSGVMCIHEEVLDPDHILDMTSDKAKGKEGVHAVKDLKKNLRRAEKADVSVEEVTGKWHPEERRQVEEGLTEWKKAKGVKGVQLASTTGQPWIDEEHRRYWVARHEGKIVGVLILTPIHGPHIYLIKNAVSFPSAPRGTSEHLIHTSLQHIQNDEKRLGYPITVTFGITASDHLVPKDNLSGWKISSLSKVYERVAKGAGLLKRGDFRGKFDSGRLDMYVCYPPDGFGLEGVRSLLKVLKK